MVYQAGRGVILSADEFLAHPDANERTELVRGRIRMMTPASAPHGLVSGNVFSLLSAHVRQHRLGTCFADSTGYALPNLPNTVRAPDASFVRADRLPAEGISGGFLKLAPDLAVEVLSPSESESDLAEKLADYRIAGTALI
jgi:Uma2 family endonuclease